MGDYSTVGTGATGCTMKVCGIGDRDGIDVDHSSCNPSPNGIKLQPVLKNVLRMIFI